MEVLFFLVPAALMLAGAAGVAFAMAVKNGQYDDLEADSVRFLQDD